jgi:hypothetical protein
MPLDEGGDNRAVIATLIENCKLSGINPHTWLTEALAKLANGLRANRVGELSNYPPPCQGWLSVIHPADESRGS